MTPWYQAEDAQGRDGTHALVIGVSDYRYLPTAFDEATPDGAGETLGLTSVTTPAVSAWRFANWLTGGSGLNRPETPLASVRLLLSPSQAEVDATPALGDLDAATVPPPTRDNVLDALYAWRDACNARPGNLAVLYVAGHGIQLSKDDSLVLLHDFGRAHRPILDAAMDLGSIWRGMAGPEAARLQYYFVDACRTKPGLFDDYLSTRAGVAFDVTDEGGVESAPIFYSASPRTLALGLPADGTLFCQALLRCLDGEAAELDADGRWVVSTSSLVRHLPAAVDRLAAEHQARQSAVVGGLLRDGVFHYLPEPPEVDLGIHISPETAAARARFRLADFNGRQVYDRRPVPPEIDLRVKAGLYALQLEVENDGPPVLRPFLAAPPRHREEIAL